MTVIQFLTARNVSSADTHHQIYEVYGPNAMSDSKEHKLVRAFKDKQDNIHDEKLLGQPSIITNDLVYAVDAKIYEEFRKVYSQRVSRLLYEEHKKRENGVLCHF